MGVIFKLSSFGRFRQSCRCMKLENSGRTRGFMKPAAEGRWIWTKPVCLNNGIEYFAIELPFHGLLAYSFGVFHWQPAVIKIANGEKNERCFFPLMSDEPILSPPTLNRLRLCPCQL